MLMVWTSASGRKNDIYPLRGACMNEYQQFLDQFLHANTHVVSAISDDQNTVEIVSTSIQKATEIYLCIVC